MDRIRAELEQLSATGNYRHIPVPSGDNTLVDFSSNDYLGIAEDTEFQSRARQELSRLSPGMTASASRLLAADNSEHLALEKMLGDIYAPYFGDHRALLFNSGYHANTGMICALGGSSTLFIADKLVHASIIDGLVLSKSRFERFRHNDLDHLERLIAKYGSEYSRIVIVVESVYSMDGDAPDLERLASIKRSTPGAMLYVDEAHAVGVCGPQGLGLCANLPHAEDVDIMVGTFGKALASFGAYAVLSPTLKEYMVNRARALIFSTSIPPAVARWSAMTLQHSLSLDEARAHLSNMARILSEALGVDTPSHIMPVIIGDAARTLQISETLKQQGLKVLPIRTPTVPPGTERLRISLSAAHTIEDVQRLATAIRNCR